MKNPLSKFELKLIGLVSSEKERWDKCLYDLRVAKTMYHTCESEIDAGRYNALGLAITLVSKYRKKTLRLKK